MVLSGDVGSRSSSFTSPHFRKAVFTFLVLYYFCCITPQAQYFSEVRQAFLDALDCDAQVLNVRNLHIFKKLVYIYK